MKANLKWTTGRSSFVATDLIHKHTLTDCTSSRHSKTLQEAEFIRYFTDCPHYKLSQRCDGSVSTPDTRHTRAHKSRRPVKFAGEEGGGGLLAFKMQKVLMPAID